MNFKLDTESALSKLRRIKIRMSESAVMALTRNIKGSQLNASCSDFIIIIRLSMTLQRGNAVSVHNTMVTEKIAVATIILYV